MVTKSKSNKPAAKSAIAKAAAVLSAAPAAAPAKAATVALRGGQAVSMVKLTGNPYRTGAKHNADWWAQITTAAAGGKSVPVATLVAAKVPAPFIGYAIRRGYLVSA